MALSAFVVERQPFGEQFFVAFAGVVERSFYGCCAVGELLCLAAVRAAGIGEAGCESLYCELE